MQLLYIKIGYLDLNWLESNRLSIKLINEFNFAVSFGVNTASFPRLFSALTSDIDVFLVGGTEGLPVDTGSGDKEPWDPVAPIGWVEPGPASSSSSSSPLSSSRPAWKSVLKKFNKSFLKNSSITLISSFIKFMEIELFNSLFVVGSKLYPINV